MPNAHEVEKIIAKIIKTQKCPQNGTIALPRMGLDIWVGPTKFSKITRTLEWDYCSHTKCILIFTRSNSHFWVKGTKEEEEDIVIANVSSSEIFEECSLSLFGRLLSDRHQNMRALKNTLKVAWKMGSDLRIMEVGNNLLQFKFSSRYQLKWVEKSGPWNFDNNLLLLCRWRKGLTSKKY